MEEIISILRNDEHLKQLIGDNIYPYNAPLCECLIYSFYTTQDNGVKSIDVLDVTSVAYSIGKAKQVLERVKELILTTGNDNLTNKILNVSLNGGGSLSNAVGDKTMYHFKAYFNIVRRK